MRQRMMWLALAFAGSLGLLPACDKPCQTSNQCGATDVCVATTCQSLSCDSPLFLSDPQSGACVALSSCFLTAAQMDWKACSQDPCKGLAESSCVQDSRCQPVYQDPAIPVTSGSGSGSGSGIVPLTGASGGSTPASFCAEGGVAQPVVDPPLLNGAPGVNNGTDPKHPAPVDDTCFPNTARSYAGCRAVPQITPQPDCSTLNATQCATRRDCSTTQPGSGVTPVVGPITNGGTAVADPIAGPIGETPPVATPVTDISPPAQPVCFDLHPIISDCASADALSCLTNPACQPIGSPAYCPPGTLCNQSGGAFGFCESNDHLARCNSTADCGAGQRCDNDEACITPRTYSSPPGTATTGSAACVGACVPVGCTGYGENDCNQHPECNGGSYGTVCVAKPYCGGGMLTNGLLAPSSTDCGCSNQFVGCADQVPAYGIRTDRSLLIRDPEIVSDPAVRIDNVIAALAPAGQADAFVQGWFAQYSQTVTLANGTVAAPRAAVAGWVAGINAGAPLTAAALAGRFHTTSLVNRLDLATASDCGEARVTFALNDAYTNGDQRMTIIVETTVPDDGNHCLTVAQRWAELSAIDDLPTRKQQLLALFAEQITPARLAQVRTNEFINPTGTLPWELREWHLNAQGMLALAPVKQTVAVAQGSSADFLTWARGNLAAIQSGTVIIPDAYLAATSTENGGRIALAGSATDANLKAAETGLNALACAGCHLTETQSPFVHLAERMGQLVGQTYVPTGRAVADDFLQGQLVVRAKLLEGVVTGRLPGSLVLPWRPVALAKVH